MRNVSLWRALLGVERTVIEEVEFDTDGQDGQDGRCWWPMCVREGGPWPVWPL